MINYLLVLTVVTSLMSVLKLLYNDPRPYMVYPIVQAKECAAEYGNPSGHAMLNSFAGIYGMSVLGGSHLPTYNPRKFTVACVIYGIFLLWVGFSRVHLGVHGLNQVVLGWVYSLAFFALFRVLLFTSVNKRIREFALLRSKTNSKQYARLAVSVAILYFVVLFSIMGIFMGVKGTYEESNNGWNAKIESACSVIGINSISNKYLYNKCFIDSGVMGFPFGLLITIILVEGRIDDCAEFGTAVARLSWKTRILRMGAIAFYPFILFAPIAVFFQLVVSAG